MEMHTTYILYSEKLDRFYVGSTSTPIESRIQKHLSNHKGYTGKAKDWVLKFSTEFKTVQESRNLEKKIKKRGAARFMLDLEK